MLLCYLAILAEKGEIERQNCVLPNIFVIFSFLPLKSEEEMGVAVEGFDNNKARLTVSSCAQNIEFTWTKVSWLENEKGNLL